MRGPPLRSSASVFAITERRPLFRYQRTEDRTTVDCILRDVRAFAVVVVLFVVPGCGVRKLQHWVVGAHVTGDAGLSRVVNLVVIRSRLALLSITYVMDVTCATCAHCVSLPRGRAVLQALCPEGIKVKIAGITVGRVLVALVFELSHVIGVRSASMAAEWTAREG